MITVPKISGSESQLWNKTWGSAGSDAGQDLWCDGSYVYTAGYTGSTGSGSIDVLLVKWNALTGQEVWSRTWGGSGADFGYGVWGDGTGIYVVGSTKSYGALGSDALIIKWDQNGNKLWNNTWPVAGDDILNDAWGNSSDIYTVGVKDYNSGHDEILFAEWLPSNGNIDYINTWGGSRIDRGCGIVGLPGGVYTVSYSNSYTTGQYDIDTILMKWHSNSVLAWNVSFGGSRSEWAAGIWSDGSSLYTFGWTDRNFSAERDCLIVKWDLSGNVLWDRAFGSTLEESGSSIWGSGSSIFTLGRTVGFGAGNDDQFLIKWNSTGSMLWYRTWGGSGIDQGNGIWTDGNVVFTGGVTCSFSDSAGDLSLVKWNARGQQPSADFAANITTILKGAAIQFNYTGSDGDGLVSYQWSLGDGSGNFTTRNVIHQFTTTGVLPVSLTVVDVDGDASVAKKAGYITVTNLVPVANFIANITTIPRGSAIQFNYTGTDGDGIVSYQWNFGDGPMNATIRNPQHVYSSAGQFKVQLLVFDVNGDASFVEKNVYITVTNLIPAADFTATPTSAIKGTTIQFNYTGTDGDGIVSYQWNFGDGTANATTRNPQHTYASTGNYTVILMIIDANGDRSKVLKNAYISVTEPPVTGPATPSLDGFPVEMLGVMSFIMTCCVVIYFKRRFSSI